MPIAFPPVEMSALNFCPASFAGSALPVEPRGTNSTVAIDELVAVSARDRKESSRSPRC